LYLILRRILRTFYNIIKDNISQYISYRIMVLGLKWIQQGKAELINGRTEVFLLLLIIPWQVPQEYKYVTSIYETYISANPYSGLEWHCTLVSGLPKSEVSSCNEFYKIDKINYFMFIGLSRWIRNSGTFYWKIN